MKISGVISKNHFKKIPQSIALDVELSIGNGIASASNQFLGAEFNTNEVNP